MQEWQNVWIGDESRQCPLSDCVFLCMFAFVCLSVCGSRALDPIMGIEEKKMPRGQNRQR